MTPAAIKWWGGKQSYLKYILPALPNGKFIDVFGGGGSVVQNYSGEDKVYNDLHPGLYLFFSCLRCPERFKELIRVLELTPYSREGWNIANDWISIPDPIHSAAAFFAKIQQSFAGSGKQWSRDKKERPRGASGFQAAIYNLKRLHRIWQPITVENLDWRECVRKYRKCGSVLYLDPPYDCPSGENYEIKFTAHREMLDYLHRSCQCFFAVSGYKSDLYDSYEWDRRLTWSGMEKTGQKKVEEVLWIREAR